MAKRYVNKAGAGSRKEYAKVLERIDREGVCPFCEDYFLKYHTRPILKKSRHWIVTENFAPYDGAKHQFLFVHRGHIEDAHKLSSAAWSDLLTNIKWLTKKYQLPALSFFMRTGDSRYTHASVAHLHAQALVGGTSRKKLRVTLAFKTK